MTLVPGTRLGPYELLAPLGAGGMGEVYRARDTRLDRPVAIKLLQARLADDPEQRVRFDREAHAISRLVHPNICTLFDVGEHDGRRFLVMELLEGETLAQRIGRGPLPLDETLRIARDLAAALAAAHRRGLVHRDVKPANVMLTEHGAKLVDFGLTKGGDSRAQGAAADATMVQTRAGMILGTIAYMSPEQLAGGPVDQRADVYAFGVTLYEMCTGQRPFAGASEAELMVAVLRDTPPSAGSFPGVPPGLGAIIDRCLERDATRRFASAEGVQAELARDPLAPAPPRVTRTESGAAADRSRLPRVGVLDFRNITGDPAFDWLSTGIAETVTVDLKKLSTFAVMGRDKIIAVFGAAQAERQQSELTASGRLAGLDLVVTGGFQTMGKAVRLTASLVDVEKGEVTGSVKVDGVLDEIFGLQDRLIGGLAEAAHVEVPDSARHRLARPRDPEVEAYELFARGRQLVLHMGPAGLSEARGLLERAVELDPRYAIAYAALGSAWAMRFIATSDKSDLDVAVSYLTRSIELDPHVGEPHAWLSYCRARQGRFAEARAAGLRAVELDPGGFYGPYFLGAALWMEGDEAFRPGVWGEAVRALLLAIRSLPRAVTAWIILAAVHLRRGCYDEAARAARRAIEIDESQRIEGPRMPGAHALLGLSLLNAGDDDEAASVLAASAERLAGQDHVYTPYYSALTRLAQAELAVRRAHAADALARGRQVLDICQRHPRSLGIGWLAVRGRLAVAAAAHALVLSRERDDAISEALRLMRDRAAHDFSTVTPGGLAYVWQDLARLYARLGRDDDGFDALVASVEAGWSDPAALERQPDLAVFRSRPEFARLLQVVAERAELPLGAETVAR